jgi:hypothetical protein
MGSATLRFWRTPSTDFQVCDLIDCLSPVQLLHNTNGLPFSLLWLAIVSEKQIDGRKPKLGPKRNGFAPEASRDLESNYSTPRATYGTS